MKRKISLALIVALVAGANLFAQDKAKGFQQFTLDNGLTVYLWEDNNQPDVHGRVVVRAGSIDEPQEYTGLAHYLEHVLFKGTQKIGALDWAKEQPLYEEIIKLYDQLAETTDEAVRLELTKKINEKSMEAAQYGATDDFSNLVEGMGGEGLNAFTSYDVTAYFNNFPAFQMEKWLELNSERLIHPVFRAFQAELENVFEEYNMYQDNNNTHVSNFIFSNLYKGHPYERDVIGKMEHIKNPRLSKLIEHYERWYVPNNMALILVGNFDATSAIPMIKEKFGRLQAKPLPERPKYENTDLSTNPTVSAKLGYYPEVMWGYNGLRKGDKDELLLDFCIELLNNDRGTGLLDKLNLDGEVLSCGAVNDARRDEGRVLVFAIPYFDSEQRMFDSNKTTSKIVMSEVDKLKDGNIPDWLFQSVKDNMLQNYELMFESTSSKTNILTEAFTYNLPVEKYINMDKSIQVVTKEDVQVVAQKYFSGDHMTLEVEEGTPKKTKIKKPEIKPLDPPKGQITEYNKQFKQLSVGTVKEEYNNFGDVTKTKLYDNVTLFTTKNTQNNIFTLTLKYGVGTEKLPKLKYAAQLMNTAGMLPNTEAQDLRRQYSELGASYSFGVSGSYFYIQIVGDEKNIEKVCQLMQRQILMPKLDKKKMDQVFGNEYSSRSYETKEVDILSDALIDYVFYNDKSDYIDRLSLEEVYFLGIGDLIPEIAKATEYALDVHYVGNKPASEAADLFKRVLPMKEGMRASESPIVKDRVAYDKSKIYFLANANAQQAKIYFYINGFPYEITDDVDYEAFDQYFSGGFNGLVMNEIREKRSMAYTAYGVMSCPPITKKNTFFIGYVGTQPDKVADAVDVYMNLLTDMPLYPERLDNIKVYLRQSSLTSKPSFRSKSQAFDAWQRLGYTDDPAKVNMDKVDALTFDQIKAFYEAHIKGKPIVTVIMGDPKTINLKQIESKWGKITKVSRSTLFSKE
ncbi:MAG: insulinase family protein [Paludibacteraceae bacterium]|jgi:zinc protease|nr:insulinase family protein [Paludibacteraceae bacterium]